MTDDTDPEHVVTATEPAWVVEDHAPNNDGEPEPINGRLEIKDLIESHYDEATYECTCGADLADWDDVQTHFKEVTP